MSKRQRQQTTVGEAAPPLDDQNAQLTEALQRELVEKRALLRAITAVSSSLELTTVLSALAEQMGQAIDVTSVYITDWNPEAGKATVIAEYFAPQACELEQVSDLGVAYDVEKMLAAGQLARLHQGNHVTSHIDDPDLSRQQREHMLAYGARSILVIPLFARGMHTGYADLWESRDRRDFTEAEIYLCQAIAQQAAIAMANAQLYQAEAQRRREAEILNEVAGYLTSTLELEEVLQRAVDAVRRYLTGVQSCSLATLEENGQWLRTRAEWVEQPWYSLISVGESVRVADTYASRMALESREPVAIADLHVHPFSSMYLRQMTRMGIVSLLCVPLLVQGSPIGVLQVNAWREPRRFSAEEIALCQGMANQAAVAIENARLHEETWQQAQELAGLHQVLRRQADALAGQVEKRTTELQSERDRTLIILESAGEGIILTDVNANILYANPALEQQSGYKRPELINQNPHILNSGETPAAVFKEMWTTILSGQRWSGELRNRHKSGRVYDVRITITPILDQEETITGFVSIESDISHLKEVDRLKAAFITHVSHELRTPLTNIKTYISLLERGQAEKRDRYLQILRHEADRLARLIQDMLDLSRLETEPVADPPVAADLKAIVDPLLVALKATAKGRQIAFQYNIPAALPQIQIGQRHLEQVLNNLLSNAFAYTPAEGQVWLSAGTQREGETFIVWIEIADNGPGIAPEDKPRLFERFFRGQITLDNGIPGAGLGLAVAKEIVERYGGRIDVRSEPGSDTSFTVCLPAARLEQGHDTT